MFEHAQVTPPNPNMITDQEARIIPDGLTLPPPALLWEWLSYIYQTTGEWWRPPVRNTPAKPASSLANAPVMSVKEFQSYSRSLQPAHIPTKPAKTLSPKALSGRTGFDYGASAYYEEAGRLLEQAASIHILDGIYAECRLVLSFIIAWTRFSLFADLPVDGMSWMAYSFSKAACELKMRASTFKTCLDALQAAGLLKPVNLSEGLVNYATLAELQRRRASLSGEAAALFNAHFFQKNTTLYLLPVALSTDLPEFKPFTEGLAGPGKTSEDVVSTKIGPESLSRPFQKAACKNESKNENEENYFSDDTNEATASGQDASKTGFVAPGKLESVLESLNSQGQSIYRFISKEAHFEGYCRLSDGRETLDDWEALKFATSGRHTLEQVTARYFQVKEVWESQEKCNNPLALLHWALTNDVDPRRGKLRTASPGKKTVYSQPAAKSPSYETPRARPQLSYQKRMFSHNELANPRNFEEVLPAPESPKIFEPPFEIKEPEKVWKIVFEDLTGRFQLASSKLALLQDATLWFKTEDASQVEVVLRSIWEERQLDGSTRHLINLALRQRLGPGLEVSFSSK